MSDTQKRDADKYQEFLDDTIAEKKRIGNEIQELRLAVIGHWRSFTATLLTIDVALVGAMLTVLTSNSNALIQSPVLAVIGVLLLLTDAVLIVYYSVEILYNDDTSLSKRQDFLDGTHNEIIDVSKDFYNTGQTFKEFDKKYLEKLVEFSGKEKELVKETKKKEKSGNWLLLMGYLFILGLVFTASSVVPISWWDLAGFFNNLCDSLHLSK